VLKDGHPHRLCQQCNRLQPLADFRGSRRSCEKQLKVHASRIKQRKTKKQEEAKVRAKDQAMWRLSSKHRCINHHIALYAGKH
jgi:hypothetical protein